MESGSALPKVRGAQGPYDRKVIARARRALARGFDVSIGARDSQGLRDVVAFVDGGRMEHLGALGDSVGQSLRAYVVAVGVRRMAAAS